MIVDPWSGYNQGVALLNDTLTTARAQDRQTALDAQNSAAARQQLAMGAVQLQGVQRQEQNRQDAVNAAANVQPGVRTTLYDQQGPPQPVDNSAGLSAREALAQKIAQLRDQEYNPAMSFGDNDLPPGVPNITQGVADRQNQDAAALQAQMDAIPADAQVAGAPLPQVAVQEPVPVTDADRIGAMIQSYMKNGEPEKAAALYKMAHEQAKTQGDMNAVGGGSLTDYYTKVAKASLTAAQSEQIEKGLTTVASLAKEGPQYLKMAEPSIKLIPGFESFSADSVTVDPSKRFTSIDAGNGQTIIIDNQNPKDWKLEKKDPVTDFSSFHAGGLAKGLSEGQISQAWHDQKLAEQKAGRMLVVNNPANPKSPSGGLSEQAVDDAAKMYNITGALPSGRNKEANAAIQNRAAEQRQASGQTAAGVIANAGDLKAINQSISQQEKQVGTMGSFVKNIDKQVNRFEQISKELGSADTRLLNIPLRALRGQVAGSPLQAKVDMYLTEISSETGKLASGATGSVAELSQGAREKWEKIHDPNLSMADLLDVLKETRHAGSMRMDSVNEQLTETRKKRAGVGSGSANPYPQITQYIKSNLGKHPEAQLISAIKAANPTITPQEIHAAYVAATGGR